MQQCDPRLMTPREIVSELASIRGRLYELPSGIPVLEVPEADVQGHGTGGPCLYRRVLMPAIIHGVIVPAWLYASGRPPDRHARPLPGSRWR